MIHGAARRRLQVRFDTPRNWVCVCYPGLCRTTPSTIAVLARSVVLEQADFVILGSGIFRFVFAVLSRLGKINEIKFYILAEIGRQALE